MSDAFFTRSDMEPVPLAHQTWTGWTFAAYWFSDLVNAGSWTQISSFVGLGMTWWEGVIATFIGGFLIAIAIVFNGIAGARLHTPFAVSSRAAFGYYLSRFAVVSRMGECISEVRPRESSSDRFPLQSSLGSGSVSSMSSYRVWSRADVDCSPLFSTYQGGIAIRICLTAIWPSFAHFKNRLPESGGVTSSEMLCFFLFVSYTFRTTEEKW